MAANLAGKPATCTSLTRCRKRAMGASQLWAPAAGPIKKPKYFPQSLMVMSSHSGILLWSQFLISPIFSLVQLIEVRIKIHLLGLRVSPVTFRKRLKSLARGTKCKIDPKAAPISSAQANTFPSPGWTIAWEKDHSSGSIPTLNKAPDSGHPWRTPEKR